MSGKASILYFSHGGGPLPLLNDPSHRAMADFLKSFPQSIPTPEAILVFSAHWEEPMPIVLTSDHPAMLFDYYGFPAESYTYDYPAPGNPRLAEEIIALLHDNRIPASGDSCRGFDHGTFVPLLLMYPNAEIPTVQISLVKGLDPELHLEIGKTLKPLKDRNILVIGSGFSFHNMLAFQDNTAGVNRANDAFQDWLTETCCEEMAESERIDRLIYWEDAPNARFCHPREEHLLPLHVCAGMAGRQGKIVFDDEILGKRAIGVFWRE